MPIVRFDHETWRLGGAANVANNIVALGGHAETIGVVGGDGDASRMLAEMAEAIDRHAGHRQRSVALHDPQAARRHDAESAGGAHRLRARSRDRRRRSKRRSSRKIDELASSAHAIVISDYLKGVDLARRGSRGDRGGRARNIPVLVDPKVPHIEYYSGASVITPNHHEAEAVTHMRIRSSEDARQAAQTVPRAGRMREPC